MNRQLIFKLLMLIHQFKSNFIIYCFLNYLHPFKGIIRFNPNKNILLVFVIIMNNELVFYIL